MLTRPSSTFQISSQVSLRKSWLWVTTIVPPLNSLIAFASAFTVLGMRTRTRRTQYFSEQALEICCQKAENLDSWSAHQTQSHEVWSTWRLPSSVYLDWSAVLCHWTSWGSLNMIETSQSTQQSRDAKDSVQRTSHYMRLLMFVASARLFCPAEKVSIIRWHVMCSEMPNGSCEAWHVQRHNPSSSTHV